MYLEICGIRVVSKLVVNGFSVIDLLLEKKHWLGIGREMYPSITHFVVWVQ